jgi:hypothetical protein
VTSYLTEDAQLIRSMLSGTTPPDDAEALFLIYAVLMRAKGVEVTAADVHDAWVAWMQVKKPDHPALAPFDALESATQRQDEPYVKAIRSAAALRGSDQ